MTTPFETILPLVGQLPDAVAVGQVQEAAAKRLRELDKAAYDRIETGRRARIGDSLTPAFLRRLTGTVQERNSSGKRVGFLLDEESTRLLRNDYRNNRYRIPDDVSRYRIPGSGLPLSALDLIEGD